MNVILRYCFLFVISAIIHIIILSFFNYDLIINIKKEKEIDVVIKEKPKKKITRKTREKIPFEKELKEELNIARPKIELPETLLSNRIEITPSKIGVLHSKEVKVDEGSLFTAIEKEIESIENNNIKEIKDNKTKEVVKNSFFEIKEMTNRERKIVYIPEKKSDFSLPRNTDLILEFNINKEGVPYNISFVNRSAYEIEKIALDFVKNIRFAAVDYDSVDKVRIVLHFTVN
ncbi:MAG: hypothetical protein SVN78_00505 [Deferribacterota bacterium]|nr:hypothetical protein [Deferribacterota bacterium]